MIARRRLTAFLAPAIALASYGTPADAAPAVEPPKSLEVADPNAALRYWAAFALFAPEMFEKAAAINWELITKELDPAKMTKEYRDAVDLGLSSAIDQLLVASRTARCDFEPQYDQGVECLLPHLGKMRATTRVLRFDARRLLIERDVDGAVERVGAILRMGNHLASDKTIISSLVGIAMGSIALDEVEVIAGSGRLTDSARQSLLEALRSVDAKDPMGIREALAFERIFMSNWIRRKFTGPGAGRELAEYVVAIGVIADELAEVHGAALAVFDEEAIRGDLDRFGAAVDECLTIWDGPDAKSRLDDLSLRIGSGDYGHLAAVFAPAPAKVWFPMNKFRTEVKAAIDKVATGGGPGPGAGAASKKGAVR